MKSGTFGTIVSNVPVAFNNVDQPTKFKNMIEQYQSIDLTLIQHQAHLCLSTVLNPIDLILDLVVTPWIACILDPGTNDNDNKIFYS